VKVDEPERYKRLVDIPSTKLGPTVA